MLLTNVAIWFVKIQILTWHCKYLNSHFRHVSLSNLKPCSSGIHSSNKALAHHLLGEQITKTIKTTSFLIPLGCSETFFFAKKKLKKVFAKFHFCIQCINCQSVHTNFFFFFQGNFTENNHIFIEYCRW